MCLQDVLGSCPALFEMFEKRPRNMPPIPGAPESLSGDEGGMFLSYVFSKIVT